MSPIRVCGFTLVELLVSVALGVGIITVAWSGFRQALKSAQRQQTLVSMHQAGRFVYEKLNRDLGATANVCAAYLNTEPATASSATDPHDGRVTLVFMTTKMHAHNYRQDTYISIGEQTGDLEWTMFRWSKRKPVLAADGSTVERNGVLEMAQSTKVPRAASVNSGKAKSKAQTALYWGREEPGKWWGLAGQTSIYLPTPVRTLVEVDKGTGYPVLNGSGSDWSLSTKGFEGAVWGMILAKSNPAAWTSSPTGPVVPTWSDFGDLDDLRYNLEPVSEIVRACSLQVINTDGSTSDSDPVAAAAAASVFWDGIPIDGKPGFHLAPPGSPQPDKILSTVDAHGRRPAQLIINLTLADPEHGVVLPLLFAIPLSSIQP